MVRVSGACQTLWKVCVVMGSSSRTDHGAGPLYQLVKSAGLLSLDATTQAYHSKEQSTVAATDW